ncbi:MAG: SH3 domain-containing protein [Caldilineaceae bacterium SB0670_bin_27]|uniref:SH3 domain-containing protein n=1 Tax=Caldilineaceae bacterium SB0664_bin_27 TaxID=2605260 RepID=A0A6B0YPN9_9CHLR|nr:SH3 domain-containing protein [Caldilineaceae bacterium SB0664_bin_27]MYJ77284.1 SH3 domain-containing protein [Caldilineaceae bacterium SB0670_bin_27]
MPHRRQMPVLRPEVIIEIPAPANRTRRFVWLGAAAVPLIITLIALSALAIRSQNTPTTAQEATVEARVALRLTEEWSKNQPQYAATAALEATVEARVAMRLAEERAIRAQQQSATAAAAGEPTVGLTTDTAEATPAAAEGAPLYARSSAVVNLRRGPGQTYESLGLIPSDERLRLLGRTIDSGWFYVAKTDAFSAEEELGWVAGWLVDVPGDPMLLEVVSPDPLATQRE